MFSMIDLAVYLRGMEILIVFLVLFYFFVFLKSICGTHSVVIISPHK